MSYSEILAQVTSLHVVLGRDIKNYHYDNMRNIFMEARTKNVVKYAASIYPFDEEAVVSIQRAKEMLKV